MSEPAASTPPALRLPRVAVRRIRNVAEVDLELCRERSLLVGENGQGKTTLLEAAYLLGAVRSFRGARAADLVQHGQDTARVRGWLEGPEPSCEVILTLGRGQARDLRVDGKRGDLSAHFRRFPMVAFHPGDLDLVLGAPADRRRFLDRMLFQAQAGYATWHREYGRALRSRNELLRREAPVAELRAYDEVMAARGAAMGEARRRLSSSLDGAIAAILDELEAAAFDVRLEAAVEPDEEALRAALEAALPTDRARRRTSVGPHTDDLVIERREGRAQKVASRGEARALAVALRLAERGVVGDETGSTPLLLLDDVAAELDRRRTHRVVEMVTRQGGQVVATATGAVEETFGSGWSRFEIRGGEVVGQTEG